jgi:hypothetical protein
MENIHEICFWLNAEAMNENPSCAQEFYGSSEFTRGKQSPKAYVSSLVLKSCVIDGFYNHVRGGCNSSIVVYSCFLSDSTSSSVMLVNPRYL